MRPLAGRNGQIGLHVAVGRPSVGRISSCVARGNDETHEGAAACSDPDGDPAAVTAPGGQVLLDGHDATFGGGVVDPHRNREAVGFPDSEIHAVGGGRANAHVVLGTRAAQVERVRAAVGRVIAETRIADHGAMIRTEVVGHGRSVVKVVVGDKTPLGRCRGVVRVRRVGTKGDLDVV